MYDNLDIERALRGADQITVEGLPNTPKRMKAIEDAIKEIGEDPAKALSKAYIGIKRYAHFPEEREDHKPGYGPSHGSIVFRVRRIRWGNEPPVLNEDTIYLLEAVRDAGELGNPEYDGATTRKYINLCEALRRYEKARSEVEDLERILNSFEVESH